MEDAKADIKRYDSHPNQAVVDKLCKNFRLVMSKPDSRWVSVGDPEELKRVQNWVVKNLSVAAGQAKEAIDAVAIEMKGDNHKNRVTFCYLVIKKLGKFDLFAA